MNFKRLTTLAIAGFCAFASATAFVGTSAFAQEKVQSQSSTPTATEPTKTTPSSMAKARSYRVTGKSMKGMVISLSDYVSMGNRSITAAQATEASSKGAVLALLVGSGRSPKVYFITKADGSSAQADLARMADAQLMVAGRAISRGGVMVIMADAMDNTK